MKPSRHSPQVEAEKVTVRADEIKEKGYFHARNRHGGNRLEAEGNVEIAIVKQHPGVRSSARRPEPGTVLEAPGKRSKVTIEARATEKHKGLDESGRETGSARSRVEIFGRLRRRK